MKRNKTDNIFAKLKKWENIQINKFRNEKKRIKLNPQT